MAIASYTAYSTYFNGKQRQRITKEISIVGARGRVNSAASQHERLWSTWKYGGKPGTAPTTAVVPTRATAGAFGQQNSSGTQRLVAVNVQTTIPAGSTLSASDGSGFASVQAPGPWGLMIISDRVSHQGSGARYLIRNGTLTTNMPTAALTRYTDGVGVEACLEMDCPNNTMRLGGFSGGTFNLNMSYTDDGNNSGNSSPTIQFTGTEYLKGDQVIPLPLTSGDRGVRAVASLTTSALVTESDDASGGGSIYGGVVLHYPIAVVPIYMSPQSGAVGGPFESLFGLGSWFPEIKTDACLWMMIRRNQFGDRYVGSGAQAAAQRYLIDCTICED